MKNIYLILFCILYLVNACQNSQTSTSEKPDKLILSIEEELSSHDIELTETTYGIPLQFFKNYDIKIHFIDIDEKISQKKIQQNDNKDTSNANRIIEIIAVDKDLIIEREIIDSIVKETKTIYYLTKDKSNYQLIPIYYYRPPAGLIECFAPRKTNHFRVIFNEEIQEYFIETGLENHTTDKNNLKSIFRFYFDKFNKSSETKNLHEQIEIEKSIKTKKEHINDLKTKTFDNESDQLYANRQIINYKNQINEYQEILELMEILNLKKLHLPSKFLTIDFIRVHHDKKSTSEVIQILDSTIMKNIKELFYENYLKYALNLNIRKQLTYLKLSFKFMYRFQLFSRDLKSMQPSPPPLPPPQVKN